MAVVAVVFPERVVLAAVVTVVVRDRRVGEMKIKDAVARGETVTGEEAFNFFLAVLFPSDQLLCMEYNRVVHDLAGLTVSAMPSSRCACGRGGGGDVGGVDEPSVACVVFLFPSPLPPPTPPTFAPVPLLACARSWKRLRAVLPLFTPSQGMETLPSRRACVPPRGFDRPLPGALDAFFRTGRAFGPDAYCRFRSWNPDIGSFCYGWAMWDFGFRSVDFSVSRFVLWFR